MPADSIPSSATYLGTGSASTPTAADTQSPPVPLDSDQTPSPDPELTSAARTAFLASLSSIGTQSLYPLEQRAADISAASTNIGNQQAAVAKQTAQLSRQADEYKKLAEEGARGLKEIGDVGNWADMLERDLAVLEDCLGIVEAGEVDSAVDADAERAGAEGGDDDVEGSSTAQSTATSRQVPNNQAGKGRIAKPAPQPKPKWRMW